MRVLSLAAAVLVGLGLIWAGAPSGSADRPGPAFTVPEGQLAAAVHCDDGARSGTRQTVLLIPGTGATPSEAWSWNYERALPAAGYGVCTVALPQRALRDFARSAEYAAFAALSAHRISGRPIAIVGHSQGGLLAAWIAKFWPEVAAATSGVISLAGPMNGTALADSLCAAGSCSPIAWQMRTNSLVTQAFQHAPLPPGPAFTSIASRNDEVVSPQPAASALPGGRTVLIQDICPGRVADHGLLLSDAVAYRLVLDALSHPGPADPARIDRSVCREAMLPDLDATGVPQFSNTLMALTSELVNAADWVTAEQPLPAYAAPFGG
jgi:predicted alpha/beta hydrolase family esterase